VHLRDRIGAYRLYLILSGSSATFLWLAFGVNLVFQVERVGLNPLQIILVGTVLEATCLLFEIPTGVVADVYSRRLSIIIGTALLGGGMIVSAVPSFWVILLAQFIMGIGYTFLSGAEEAWIADEIGERHAGRAFLRGSQFSQIGSLVGVPIGVGLATIQLNLPIVIGGVLQLLLAGFLVVMMTERGFSPAPREERGSWEQMRSTFVGGAHLVKRRPVLLSIFGIAFFMGMFSEGFDRLWTPHFLENYTFPGIGDLQPVVWIGIITVAASVLKIVAAEVVRRKVDTNSHTAVSRVLFAMDAVQIVGVLIFALVGSFALALVAFLVASVLRSTASPLTSAWLNQSLDSRVRATVISMSGQADAIGQIAGGPGIGAIGTVFSLRAALGTAAIALIPSLGLYARSLSQGEEPLVMVEDVGVTGNG
jgi:DHA3 family tetracycline resistance protein-like MFS transporter